MDGTGLSAGAVGFDAFYGLEIGELTPESARAALSIRPEHKQPWGIVHGGIYASMAEGLTSVATAVVVGPLGLVASGISNHSSFLRPATEGTLHAVAVRKHAGRTTWVWEVEISDDQGRLCAISRTTIAVRAPDPAQHALASTTECQEFQAKSPIAERSVKPV